jgi:hypothetical protein
MPDVAASTRISWSGSGSDLATRATDESGRSVDTLSTVKTDRWAMGKPEQHCSHAEVRIAMPVRDGIKYGRCGGLKLPWVFLVLSLKCVLAVFPAAFRSGNNLDCFP